MEDFSDVERLLRASNPVPLGNDVPVDLDALVQRIIARAPKNSYPLAVFRQRIAASVAVAALATSGLIAGISQLAPSLPVLQFAATVNQPSASSTASTNYEGASVSKTQVVPASRVAAGPGLATSSSSALLYEETAPRDPTVVTRRIARAFGINSQVVTGPKRNTWVARNTTYVLTAELHGTSELDWNISLDKNCATARCWRRATTKSYTRQAYEKELLTTAKSILMKVSTTIPVENLRASSRSNYVTTITGSFDGLREHITFKPSTMIISAQGVLTNLRVLGNYPLLSASAGLNELLTKAPRSSGLALSSLSTATEIVNVAKTTYRAVSLVKGQRVLLPYYDYFVNGRSIGSIASVAPFYVRGS